MPIPAGADVALAPAPASTGNQLVDLWLHGRGACTRRAYRSDIERLVRFLGKSLPEVTLTNLPAFAEWRRHPL
ncbi:MAG TPA: hypothetical protein VIU62_13810 [Chloroflexota bacterium]